jgi:hypothetical protein
LVKKNSPGTNESLSESFKSLHDSFLDISYQSDVAVSESLDNFETRIFLDENQRWLNQFYLLHYDAYEVVIMVYLHIYIEKLILVFLDSKRVRQQQNLRILDFFPHTIMSNTLFYYQPIHVSRL